MSQLGKDENAGDMLLSSSKDKMVPMSVLRSALKEDVDFVLQIVRLQKKVRNYEAKIEDFEKNSRGRGDEERALVDMYNSITVELQHEKAKTKLALESVSTLQDQINSLKKDRRTFTDKIKRRESSLQQYKEAISSKQKEIDSLATKIIKAKDLKLELKKFKEKNEDLESVLVEKEKTIEYLSHEINNLHLKLDQQLLKETIMQPNLDETKITTQNPESETEDITINQSATMESDQSAGSEVNFEENDTGNSTFIETLDTDAPNPKGLKKVRFSQDSYASEDSPSSLSLILPAKSYSWGNLENFCLRFQRFEFQGVGFDVNQTKLTKLRHYKRYIFRNTFYRILKLDVNSVDEGTLLESFNYLVRDKLVDLDVMEGETEDEAIIKQLKKNEILAEGLFVLKTSNLKTTYDMLLNNVHFLRNGFQCNILTLKTEKKGVRVMLKSKFVKCVFTESKKVNRIYFLKNKKEVIRSKHKFVDLNNVLTVNSSYKLSLNPSKTEIVNEVVLLGGKHTKIGVSEVVRQERLRSILELRFRNEDIILDIKNQELCNVLIQTLNTLFVTY